MNQDEREERLARILERTRELFQQETLERLTALRLSAADWEAGRLGDVELLRQLYTHMHAVKGMALTVGYSRMQLQAERLDEAAQSALENDSSPPGRMQLREWVEAAVNLSFE